MRNYYNATATNWRSRRLQTDQPPVRRSLQYNQNGPVRVFSAVTVSSFVARTVFLPGHGQLPCFETCPRVHHVSEKKVKQQKKQGPDGTKLNP